MLAKAKITKTNSVVRVPTQDLGDIIVVDDEWFERRRQMNKGYPEFKI
jgi:hypothetical protein